MCAAKREKSSLPWFACYQSETLGELAAMAPDEGYVYLVQMFRQHEVKGPISDDDVMLSRRTGVPRKQVANIIDRFLQIGKWTRTSDGRISNPIAAAEIEDQKELLARRSEAGKVNVGKRWQIDKQNQGSGDTNGIPLNNVGSTNEIPSDTHLHEHVHKQLKDSRPVPDGTRPAIVHNPFDTFWDAFPKRDGTNSKKEARNKFVAALKRGVDPNEIIAGAKRYAEQMERQNKVGTPYVARADTWLNQESWEQDKPKASAPKLIFAQEGSPQWLAWDAHLKKTGKPGAPIDNFWPDGRDRPHKRGYYFETEFPPGHVVEMKQAA